MLSWPLRTPHTEQNDIIRIISARSVTGRERKFYEKEKNERPEPAKLDELRPEYDFATMRGGVRGKYVERYRAGTNLALLAPDVADAFPTDEAVNEALRTILKAAAKIQRSEKAGG